MALAASTARSGVKNPSDLFVLGVDSNEANAFPPVAVEQSRRWDHVSDKYSKEGLVLTDVRVDPNPCLEKVRPQRLWGRPTSSEATRFDLEGVYAAIAAGDEVNTAISGRWLHQVALSRQPLLGRSL
jgi:hypothetical protein